MKTLILLAAAWLLATVGFAQELSWVELARRPELWPAHCTVKAAIRFDGGVTVSPGQQLTVLQIKPNELQLSTADGRTTFAAEPGETDALAVASADYAKLTPGQRQLSYASLAQHQELWPARVLLHKTLDLGGGKSIPPGEPLLVKDVQPERLLVESQVLHGKFYVAPAATDAMDQARRFVEDPAAGPRLLVERKRADDQRLAAQRKVEEKQRMLGKVVMELDGKLVSSTTGAPEPLDPASLPRYLVFYRGSSTCPITRKFTPTLIRYYQQMKPTHPEFEIIWIMTESPADTEKFAHELGFSWRAVTYESSPLVPTVNEQIVGLLPQLIVMDRSGKVLANGWQGTAPDALRQLDVLLKSPGPL